MLSSFIQNSCVVMWNPLASIATWFMDQIRAFFATLDSIVYNFISVLYQLLLDLADIRIFSGEVINDFATRVYALLGIFMLFKVTFSLISYVVSPDQLTDKNKGVQNIIKNILVSLVLLIITPWAFDTAQDVQNAIITDNIIPRLIIGSTTSNEITTSQTIVFSEMCCNEYNTDGSCKNDTYMGIRPHDTGEYLAFMAFRPFYQLDPRIDPQRDIPANYCSTDADSYVADILREGIVNYKNETTGSYSINYSFLLSTTIGILIALILISFCFDVAVRTIKLGFLQIIAPIPIISYVDPKSGKDGMFKKWLKSVAVTWAGLFVRLAAIFFAIYVISLIPELTDTTTYSGSKIESSMFWIHLFIILGALIFAKQLPKLLTELTGIKLDGSFQLNPFKKVQDQALLGKNIVGGASALGAAAVGGIAGGVAGVSANLATNKGLGKLKAIPGAFTGMLSGAGRSLSGGYKAGDKFGAGFGIGGVTGMINAGRSSGQIVGQNVIKKDGTSLADRTASRIQQGLGLKTAAQNKDEEIKALDEIAKLKDSIASVADIDNKNMADASGLVYKYEYNATTGRYEQSGSGYNTYGLGTKALKQKLEEAKAAGASESRIEELRNAYEASQEAVIRRDAMDINSQVGMLSSQLNRKIREGAKEFDSIRGISNDLSAHGFTGVVSELGEIKKTVFAGAKNATTRIQTSTEYETAKRTDEAVKKTK